MSQYDDDMNRWCDHVDKEDDMSDEYVDIDIDELVKETDEAILIRIGDEKIWIPQSQCEDWPNEGDSGVVIMKEWIAEDKELI